MLLPRSSTLLPLLPRSSSSQSTQDAMDADAMPVPVSTPKPIPTTYTILKPTKMRRRRRNRNHNPSKASQATTFYNACRSATPAVVQQMIRAGAKVNKPFRNICNKTPLLAAVVRGNVNVVKLLLNHGADVHGCPDIFRAAARRRVLGVMEVLLENGLVMNDDHVLWTLVLRKQHNMVRLLLDYGANPNYYDAVGRHELSKGRSLFSTAVENDDVDMVRLLVSKGADVHRGLCRDPCAALPSSASSAAPLTLPLTHAILRRKTDMIKLLLTLGCDVYAQDTRVRAQHQVEGPADPADAADAADAADGSTAKHKHGITPMEHALASPDVIRVFLEHGVCANTFVRGSPPLIVALIICHRQPFLADVLQTLLRHGADPLCKTSAGHSFRDAIAVCFPGKPDAIPAVLIQAMEAKRVEFLCRRRAVHQQYYDWGLDDTDDCLADGTLIENVVNETVRMDRKLFDKLCDMIAI